MEKVMFKRRFTEEQRVKYVNEVLESGSNVLIAKKYDINQVQLSSWVNNYRRFGQTLKPKEPKDQKIIPNYKKEYEKAQDKIKEQELKIAILEDLLKKQPSLNDKIFIANKWIKKGYKTFLVLKILHIPRFTYYDKQKEVIERSYANVGRKVPGYSLTFDGRKILDLDIQKCIVDIKNYKTSKRYKLQLN